MWWELPLPLRLAYLELGLGSDGLSWAELVTLGLVVTQGLRQLGGLGLGPVGLSLWLG